MIDKTDNLLFKMSLLKKQVFTGGERFNLIDNVHNLRKVMKKNDIDKLIETIKSSKEVLLCGNDIVSNNQKRDLYEHYNIIFSAIIDILEMYYCADEDENYKTTRDFVKLIGEENLNSIYDYMIRETSIYKPNGDFQAYINGLEITFNDKKLIFYASVDHIRTSDVLVCEM